MSTDDRSTERDGQELDGASYEPPTVRDIDTTDQPAFTATGTTSSVVSGLQ